jgi:CRP-like cAMP-binding protein
VLFHGGQPARTVWIAQHGRVELSVGAGRIRTVVGVPRPGDVDGDVQLLLDMAMPYTARAASQSCSPTPASRCASLNTSPRAVSVRF